VSRSKETLPLLLHHPLLIVAVVDGAGPLGAALGRAAVKNKVQSRACLKACTRAVIAACGGTAREPTSGTWSHATTAKSTIDLLLWGESPPCALLSRGTIV